VKADPVQLEQVVLNLVVNARDAMPDGGRLTIKTASVELDDAYARRHVGTTPGPYVMLMVSDTGVGMDAETQAHIFEPFFTTKAPDKGTGLGLATVYGIVKQGGGDIVVNSEPGRGTLVRIYLPRMNAGIDVVATRSMIQARTRGSETILLVEDDEAIRTLVRDALEGEGYRVLEAPSPNEALRIVESEGRPIDLIVTDMVMPQMSGRDLAERLTAVSPNARVLFMSGYAHPHADGDGAAPAFLAKPFTPDALARKIRDVLDGRAPGA
jgi:CheY-like chemotaxis protein